MRHTYPKGACLFSTSLQGPAWEGVMLYCVSFPPVLYCSRSLSQLLVDIQKGFFSPQKSLNHNLNHTALHSALGCACSRSSLGPLISKQSLVPDLNDIHNTVDLYPKQDSDNLAKQVTKTKVIIGSPNAPHGLVIEYKARAKHAYPIIWGFFPFSKQWKVFKK